ncbi:MAG: helix-turn-helix domain-containing protein [Firmicutes bacterium]|nr:helix-turn-helix domain-containing protein [Bacillota bacterium]
MIKYPAKYIYDKGIFSLRFIDFPTSIVRGINMREMQENAKLSLSTNIRHRLDNNLEIPFPSSYRDDFTIMIEPDNEIEIPLIIKLLRISTGQSQRQVADIIEVPYHNYQQLEQVDGFNPTFEVLKKVASTFNKELYIEFR